MQKLDPIYIDFGTPERFLSALVIGESLSFTVQAYPNETFNGKLSAIESAIDRGTRNVLARAIAENPNEKLRPGMFADISLTVPKKDEVLTIPETAVNYTAYGNSVFVIEAGDGGLRVQRTQIETGEVRDGRVAVTSGLAEGQQIVALGHNKLRNGTPVRIDEKIPLSASVP